MRIDKYNLNIKLWQKQLKLKQMKLIRYYDISNILPFLFALR